MGKDENDILELLLQSACFHDRSVKNGPPSQQKGKSKSNERNAMGKNCRGMADGTRAFHELPSVCVCVCSCACPSMQLWRPDTNEYLPLSLSTIFSILMDRSSPIG